MAANYLIQVMISSRCVDPVPVGEGTSRRLTDLLGFPDVTLVKSSFGVYAADPVQKVQVVLLAGCHNPGHIGDAVGRFFDWVARSGQGAAVAALAQARGRIVQAIAREQSGTP